MVLGSVDSHFKAKITELGVLQSSRYSILGQIFATFFVISAYDCTKATLKLKNLELRYKKM
jgi:uncharacterized membrane protein